MKFNSGNRVSFLSVIFMGFLFPAILAYLAAVYLLNIWYVGIFTFLSLLAAVAVVSIDPIFNSHYGEDEELYYRRYRTVKDALESLVERLDGVYEDLVEIDNILKMEE